MKTTHILLMVLVPVLLLGCSSTPTQATPQPTPTADTRPEVTTCPEPAPPLSGTPSGARLVVQDGHTKTITSMAFDQSGRFLASGSADGTVRVWDTHTGLMLRRLIAKGMVLGVSLSKRGDVLAFRVHDGSSVRVLVVHLASGSPPRPLDSDGAFQVSPDGQHVAVGLHQLRLYDAGTGDQLKELKLGPIRRVAFDPDGHQLAISFDDELALVEMPSLKIIRRWPHPAYKDVRDVATGLVLAGDRLVMRTGWATYLMGTKPGAPVQTIRRSILDVAAQGDRVFGTEISGKLAIWSWSTGTELPAPPLAGRAHHLAIASDGSTVAIAATERNDHVIRVVDGKNLRPIRTLAGRTTGVTALTFRPDGAQLVTGSAISALMRWDLRSGELLALTDGEESNPSRSVTFDPSGSVFATVAGTWWVRVRDGATSKLSRQWPAHDHKQVTFATFLPKGKELLTVDIQGGLRRWDLSAPPTPALKRIYRFTEVARPPGGEIGTVGWPVTRAALSPDGAWLAVAGDENLIRASGSRVIPVMQGRIGVVSTQDATMRWETQVWTGMGLAKSGIAFSADGRSVLYSATETPGGGTRRARPVPVLTAYEADTGKELRRVHPDTAGALASLDGVIAIGGRAPALLEWPSLTVRQRITSPSFDSTVAAHRKTKRFAFGGEGGATSIVTAAGKTLAMLAATATGEYITTTPDGAFVASLDGARNIAWTFEAPLEGFSFEQFAARYDRPDRVAQSLAQSAPTNQEALSRPPRVELDQRHWNPTVDAPTVPLKATVASGHRVDRLRVFVNGKLGAEKLVCASRAEVVLDVPLLSGRNRLTIIAHDAQGYASNPQVLDVSSTAIDAGRPDLWVVSVGVSHYPNMGAEQQLDFADDDARSIAAALAKQAGPGRGFAKHHVITLVDDEVTVKSLATALDQLAKMGPDDLAVVFLAGHGVRLADGKMVLLTSRAALSRSSATTEGMGWDRIEAALRKAPGRVLLLLDACHSGHVSTEVVAPNEALAQQLAAQNRTGVLVLAASRGSQLSYEIPPARPGAQKVRSRGFDTVWQGTPPKVTQALPTGHGLFTSAVLEALAGKAVDRDRSGAVEVAELIDYVTERVTEASNGKQTPWVARRELFGDFGIAPAGP